MLIPKTATKIGNHIFNECTSLTKIEIPPIIKTIQFNEFKNFVNLREFTIPSSVTAIESRSFYRCTSLTKIVIPPSVKTIGDFAFFDCNSLTEITISNSLQNLGECVFWNCSSLREITIPPLINTIPNNTFDGCLLLEKVNLPLKLTSIGDYAFYNCSSLASVTISSSVRFIGVCCFYGCTFIRNVTFAPNSNLNAIQISTFEQCSSLDKIELPPSIRIIGRFAFKNCTSLTEVNIPSSLKTIQPDVFDGCILLNDVEIPSTVRKSELCFNERKPINIFLFGECNMKEKIINFIENRYNVLMNNRNIDVLINGIKIRIFNTFIDRYIMNLSYRNADGAIFVFNIERQNEIDDDIAHFNRMHDVKEHVTSVFLGYQKYEDQVHNIVVNDELLEFQIKHKCRYFQISPTDDSIMDAIEYIAESTYYESDFYENNEIGIIDIANPDLNGSSNCSC